MDRTIIKSRIKAVFSTSLGQQVDSLFTTSDGKILIRFEEALLHAEGKLDNTTPLQDRTVLEWFEEYSGSESNPDYVYVEFPAEIINP